MNCSRIEKERQKIYNKCMRIRIVSLCIAGAFLVIAIISVCLKNVAFALVLLALAMLLTFFAIKAFKFFDDFSYKFKEDVINHLIDESKYTAKYSRRGFAPSAMFLNSNLFSVFPDKFTTEDIIEGDYLGVHFLSCDAHLQAQKEAKDKDTQIDYYRTIFRGRFFEFTFNRQMEDVIQIIEKVFGKKSNNFSLEKYELESIKFNQIFDVYSSSQQGLFYYITPEAINTILKVESFYDGRLMISFHLNKMYIVADDNKDHMELDSKRKFTYDTVEKFADQINIISDIIEGIGLGTEKYR